MFYLQSYSKGSSNLKRHTCITTLQFSYCFENVGLDFAGPLLYKEVVHNKMQKCYILFFTCSVSRAILGFCSSPRSASGVEPLKLAVRRFISRRGTPSYFISDNFKTFKSVEIKRFISNLGIKWKFI